MSIVLCFSNEQHRLLAHGLDGTDSPLRLVNVCNYCDGIITDRTFTRAEVLAFPIDVMIGRLCQMSEEDKAKVDGHICTECLDS